MFLHFSHKTIGYLLFSVFTVWFHRIFITDKAKNKIISFFKTFLKTEILSSIEYTKE